MEDDYKSFLQSLDDSQLISHISSLSQSQVRTQKDKELIGSEAFDDSFNEYLTRHIPGVVGQEEREGEANKEGDVVGDKETVTESGGQKVENELVDELLEELNEEFSDEEDDEVGPMHGFGDYNIYFDNKHKKQQIGDQNYIEWDKTRRILQGEDEYREPIFKGCVIFVNGHTIPSMNEIHRLVIIHGGKFLSYLGAKRNATHIVCDRLTPRKQQIFKNCKVVKAKWIADCVEKGYLLDWKEYRLYKEIAYDQGRLSDFHNEFALKQFNMEEEDDIELQEDSLDEESPEDVVKERAIDAKHPDFLNQFFSKSRLHHLSMWKADLKLQFINRVKRSKDGPKKVTRVVHIDFDCFFATASCQKTSYDIDKVPLAVSHGQTTSDVASCNYVARKYGVRNGSWVRSARRLCPDLIVIPYEFDLYEKYANCLYNYLISLDVDIYPVSIDEALIDMSDYQGDLDEWCKMVRQEIFRLTKCPVSIGIGPNVLLAKLSLRKAKPNGYFILDSNIDEFLSTVSVSDLPGVGHSLLDKVMAETGKSSPTITDLLQIPKEKLMKLLGPKTGQKIYDYARGIDPTKLDHSAERKSVSVDINYGIRFDTHVQVEDFLSRLAVEVSKRLKHLNVVGSQVTLKLAKRDPDSPVNPPKYLGMGKCSFLNKSAKLGLPTSQPGIISSELKSLARILTVPAPELRGIAVAIGKLEDADEVKKNRQMTLNQRISKGPRTLKKIDESDFKEPLDNDIDWQVFESLPWDIKREIKSELSRRGIIHKSASPSPGPKKYGKAYLQQLLPTATTQEPKYVRIIESPKKSPRKSPPKRSRTASPLKVEDVSYDSSILNELPSSVKNEIIEDMEIRKKYKPQTLKEKFKKSVEQTKVANLPITKDWINQQPKINEIPKFQNGDIREMIQGWMKMSLDQDGPHNDDVEMFLEYLKLLKRDKIQRLEIFITKEINYYKSIEAVVPRYSVALQEWEEVIKRVQSLG